MSAPSGQGRPSHGESESTEQWRLPKMASMARLAETTAEAVAHSSDFPRTTITKITQAEALAVLESGYLADRRKVPDNHVLELCEHVKKLAAALADAATEAECGHEMGGLAETILHRNGLRGLREYVIEYGPDTDPEPF